MEQQEKNWEIILQDTLQQHRLFDYNAWNKNLRQWAENWAKPILNCYGVFSKPEGGNHEHHEEFRWTTGGIVIEAYDMVKQFPFRFRMRFAPDASGNFALHFKVTKSYEWDMDEFKFTPQWEVEVRNNPEIKMEAFVCGLLNRYFREYLEHAKERKRRMSSTDDTT